MSSKATYRLHEGHLIVTGFWSVVRYSSELVFGRRTMKAAVAWVFFQDLSLFFET